MNRQTILGITAHPDDHVMFAGTVMKLQEKDYTYNEVLLTSGSEGVDYSSKIKDQKLIIDARDKEFSEAAKYLNINKYYKFKEEDQNLKYSKKIMHQLVKIIRDIKPEVGFAINNQDTHPDHVASAILAREAFRWAAKNIKPELGLPHRTKIVLFAEGTLPITPSVLVDISSYYQKKEELFKLYETQASSKDLTLLKSFACLRGYHLRTSEGLFAEAFTVDQNVLPILFEGNN